MVSFSFHTFLAMALLTGPTTSGGRLASSVEPQIEGVQYEESVPTPASFLGYPVGLRHTRPDQVVDYFEAVAAASDRVVLRDHGSTYEGRRLIHAIVTSPEHHQRLETIRSRNLLLSEDPPAVSDRDLNQMPAIVTMGYSVHGNEASGTEAAILLLYHLAAGVGEPVERVLRDAVVIIDPMLNPDGRARFVDWVNGNRGRIATSDPQDREHVEPWPGGRTNHYWFDLNRDWLPAQLLESQGRLELFHDWRPQLVTDFHEMGSDSTFFFQPGVPTRNNPNTPSRNLELTRRIAEYHARYLDKIGSLYYSEESYDDYYYGKGSTYPDINGSVGILFEQATSRALKRETASGPLDYAFTIRNQFTASLSSLDAAVSMRRDLLANQREFYREAMAEARRDPVRGWVFTRADEGGRAEALVEVLLRHGIAVHELKRDLEIEGRRFSTGASWIVPTAQRQARMLKVLMERVTEFSDSVFYDVSTWTLPLAFGVTPGRLTEAAGPYLGPALTRAPISKGAVTGHPAPFAYLLNWADFRAPEALYAIQEAGLESRWVGDPITVLSSGQSVELANSTIVIPAARGGRSPDELATLLQPIAERTGASLIGADSGLTPSGPDLGGPSSRLLTQPKIALICGSGTSSSQAGETWFVLSERAALPVSLIESDRFDRIDLSAYNTLILPGGSYQPLTDQSAASIKDWVRRGGLLIAFEGGVRWIIGNQIVDERLREWTSTTNGPIPFEKAQDLQRAQEIPGSIFEVTLDVTHPLARDLSPSFPVFRDHTLLLEPSKTPGANVAIYVSQPLLSGYVPAERLPQLSGSAAIIARRIGSGRVVLFADAPNFRAFWFGTTQLFFNAVFLGHVF